MRQRTTMVLQGMSSETRLTPTHGSAEGSQEHHAFNLKTAAARVEHVSLKAIFSHQRRTPLKI